MVKVATFFAMTLGAFVFWQSMDKVHVWIALRQDEKQEKMEREAEIRRVRDDLLKPSKQSGSMNKPSITRIPIKDVSNFSLRFPLHPGL
ncbi:hypothetical protein RJ639_025819 [Escallonia herrerae]|uniref:Uncharacterized protein n=1 Tax=Escallonia herrerae TaxID=1293975 RepID=A0AA88UXK7_9ASTE|nr:hypothetical protein RJ639_025819 [Escallonia herrerae]